MSEAQQMLETTSLASWLASLPPPQQQAVIAKMSPELVAMTKTWPFKARPEQVMPKGEWRGWLILAGRGFGKTRTGAEATNEIAENGEMHIGLVGESAADVRDVMIEGESGILAVARPDFMPYYEPSKRRVTWPNGAKATAFSGDKPGQLRGPQHGFVWADEPAKWRYLTDAWDQMEFGLRSGSMPRWIATTTPRPLPTIKEMLKDPTVRVTSGSTYDNAQNLAPAFIRRIQKKYEGTRLGRQEIHAKVLDDTPGALWTQALIEKHRVKTHPPLVRVVVGLDPPATSDEESSEAGIVVMGRDAAGHGYVIGDYSLHATPAEWAQAAIDAYHEHDADKIIAEKNNGGEMVEHTLRTINKKIPVKTVHASRGKYTRAEPISALWEKGECHHVGGFPVLEDQQTSYVPGEDSPDRFDALVWAATELFPNEKERKTTRRRVRGV
jgi:phage terminase large subunit-like protein